MAANDQYNRDRDELNRMRRKVDGVRGHGVTSSPYGVSLPPPGKARPNIAFNEGWWGVTVNAGPDAAEDYYDARYWVQRCRISNDDSDTADSAIEFTAIPGTGGEGDDPQYRVVTATNLTEYTSGGHTLPLGTPVWVTPQFDRSVTPTLTRFVFSAGDPTMYQRITGATAVAGRSNAWAYQWVQSRYLRNGTYEDVPGGITYTDTRYGGLLYNGMESNNSSSGMQGNGVNLSIVPATGSMKPLGVGSVVLARRVFTCDDPAVGQWRFDGANAVVVICS